MSAQSYMPAQETQVLKNKNYDKLSSGDVAVAIKFSLFILVHKARCRSITGRQVSRKEYEYDKEQLFHKEKK